MKQREEIIPKESEIEIPRPKKPMDLLTIYMETRSNLASESGFHKSYMTLLSLIDMGKEMLPDSENSLKKRAETLLMNKRIYPMARQMTLAEEIYRLGSSEDSTGIIHVHREDLHTGIEEMQNQQAMFLIPDIKWMDSQIFRALVKHNIITVKKPNLKDEIMQDFIKGFRKKVKAKQKAVM